MPNPAGRMPALPVGPPLFFVMIQGKKYLFLKIRPCGAGNSQLIPRRLQRGRSRLFRPSHQLNSPIKPPPPNDYSKKIIRSLAFLALFGNFAAAATYTSSASWDVVVSQTITGSTINATASQGTLSEVFIPMFDSSAHLGETLVGVTVTYSAPLSGQSPTIP